MRPPHIGLLTVLASGAVGGRGRYLRELALVFARRAGLERENRPRACVALAR